MHEGVRLKSVSRQTKEDKAQANAGEDSQWPVNKVHVGQNGTIVFLSLLNLILYDLIQRKCSIIIMHEIKEK